MSNYFINFNIFQTPKQKFVLTIRQLNRIVKSLEMASVQRIMLQGYLEASKQYVKDMEDHSCDMCDSSDDDSDSDNDHHENDIKFCKRIFTEEVDYYQTRLRYVHDRQIALALRHQLWKNEYESLKSMRCLQDLVKRYEAEAEVEDDE